MQYTEIQTVEAFDNRVATPKTWDRATAKVNIGDRIRAPFTPIMQVIDKDVYPNGQTWLLVKPNSGSFTEEWVVEPEEDIQQPAATQPLFEDEAAFKQGFEHGKLDAAKSLPPICAQAECQYSTGYLKGYTPTPQQTKAPVASPAWSVTYNDKWEWYTVWVGDRVIGKASTHKKAERLGQKYIANAKARQEHRQQVLAAYAG